MAPYIGYDSDTTFIPGTLNTSSSLTIQGGGITQTGGDVNFDSGTLFIDEDLNRVGIGVTTPGETLTVDSGTSVGQVIVSRFRGTASGTTGQVISILTSNLESGAELQAYSLSTTNNNGALLNLNDAIVLRSSSATSGGIAFTTANSTAPLIFATDSGERLRITPTGNVGIGITNPSTKLHVVGSTTLAGTGNRPVIIDSNVNIKMESGGWATQHGFLGSSDSNLGGFGAYGNNNSLTYYWIGQSYLSPSVVVGSSGNVGIGTTNPQAKLDVSGGILSTAITVSNGIRAATIGDYPNINGELPNPAILVGTSGNYPLSFIGDGSSGSTSGGVVTSYYSSQVGWRRAIEIFNTTSATGNLLLMKTGGNVGIGTSTPATKLHVRQSADFDGITLTHAARAGIWKIYHSGTASENIAFVQNNGTSDAVSYVAGRDTHTWYTGGTFKMLITSAGNVGVGTDNPVGKLSVSGPTDSRLLNVAEGSTARFLINGSAASVDAGNAVFYTGTAFDASNYMVLQNNTDSYGRVGLVIKGKTFSGANNPSANDGWSMVGRSGIKFDAYLVGDTGFDTKFAIQHLLANGTNNSIGDLGILAKGYSTAFPAVTLTAAGNVGIGSANPSVKFVVFGSNTVAKIESSTNYVDLQLANSQSGSGYIQYFEGHLRFFANSGSTPTLTITGGSPGRVGIGITNPNEGFTSALTAYFSSAEPIYGGFGARSTGGAEDWNHATNARSGGGWSLLTGTSANGPGNSAYFHPFSFEYASKDGGGNMTQFAIGYNTTVVYFRFRYSNVWSSWAQL